MLVVVRSTADRGSTRLAYVVLDFFLILVRGMSIVLGLLICIGTIAWLKISIDSNSVMSHLVTLQFVFLFIIKVQNIYNRGKGIF